jgi:hypothetical protein
MMVDCKSMSNDELGEILASAGAELLSRRTGDGNSASKQHLYRITMRRTAKAEPQAFRFTQVDNAIVRLPLPLDRVIGTSGKVIGGEFPLNDGDVVQKVAASGLISYLIAWQGVLDRPDYDVSRVLEGDTEAETIARIEAFVRGDRTLLIQELAETIAFWRAHLPEYDDRGKTDPYWKRVAERHRNEIQRLEAMLRWAYSDSYMQTS